MVLYSSVVYTNPPKILEWFSNYIDARLLPLYFLLPSWFHSLYVIYAYFFLTMLRILLIKFGLLRSSCIIAKLPFVCPSLFHDIFKRPAKSKSFF